MLSSCVKPSLDDNPIPKITLDTLTKINKGNNIDSFVVNLYFEDGDGDIGLRQQDTFFPYTPSSIYYRNLYIRYFEKVNGQFTEVARPFTTDTIRFSYRIPPLADVDNNKFMKGNIEVGILLNEPPIRGNDLMFKIYLYDRALNKSNEVESQIFTR